MSQIIGLGGLSGSGKSTSLKYLNPKETFIISVTPKQLAIPGFKKNYQKITIDKDGMKGNYYSTNDYAKIAKIMQLIDKTRPDIKVLCLDDINYLQSNDIMQRAQEKSWDKHVDIAKSYYDFLTQAMNMRDDLYVVLMSHIINTGDELNPSYKLFSSSKMLDRTINIDGLFNYLLYAEKIIDENTGEIAYKFRTRSTGNDTCRSTDGCFKDLYIDNNMQLVIDTINKFEMGE